MDILDSLMREAAPPAPIASVGDWFARLVRCPFEASIDRALWAGLEADRLGYAFVGGYEAALTALFDFAALKLTLPRERWPKRGAALSLAATESKGAHPRSIATTLEGNVLRGEKTFATLASVADELLVVASIPTTAERPSLRLVRVRAKAEGVVIEDRAPTPFAPEVPHARVGLDVVVAEDDILPGDGYDLYLKPFRTFEDGHVLAATLAHLLRIARDFRFEPAIIERALAMIIAIRGIAARDPSSPTTHLALAGVFAEVHALVASSNPEWEKADGETRDRWRRDLPLTMIAEGVRQKRTSAAWTALGYAGAP